MSVPDEMPPPALLAFVARQVGAEPGDYADYWRRAQTRREQIVDIMERTGHRNFDRAAFGELASWLLSIAQVNRDPMALAAALVDELRRRRILLPSAAVLELILHQARGRAERLIHRVLVDALEPDGGVRVEALLGRYATIRAFAPTLLGAFQFKGGPAVASLLRALEALQAMHALGKSAACRPSRRPASFAGPGAASSCPAE